MKAQKLMNGQSKVPLEAMVEHYDDEFTNVFDGCDCQILVISVVMTASSLGNRRLVPMDMVLVLRLGIGTQVSNIYG
jgi:hypothetical protein